MRNASMRRLIAAVATLTLFAGVAVGTTSASASRGISIGRALTVTARGPMTLTMSGVNYICTWDLALDLNATIMKSAGAPAGTLHNGVITNCSGGWSGTIDSSSPVTFLSWSGALPEIRVLTALTQGFLFTYTGGTLYGANRCQFRSNPLVTFAGPGVSFAGFSLRGSASFATGPAACPRAATISNSALTAYGAVTSVAIALI